MNIRKFINKETILYVIFGVLTTIVDFVALAILHYVFSVNEIIANTIAWIFAVAVAFITNKLYVFESKSFKLSVLKHELPSFIIARVFSLIVTDIILALASIANINIMIAKLFSSIFVIVSNYIFSKLFIFKNNNDNSEQTNIITTEENIMPIDQKNNKLKSLANLGPLLLAFIIPVVVLFAIFVGRGVHPFGDSIYLRSDMYHQYAPFYKELYNKLTSGESLFYSWNIGMGVNFTALYAYYLASPINLLLGIFAINGNILLTMDVLIIIKTGLAGFTMAYYLSKRFDKHNYSIAVAGIFYALSSYMAAYSWNIMWIDCIIILPIIALGIENLVRKKKWLMYTLSLGFAIFSNYYIAIMICIFSVIYFGIILFSQAKLTLYSACTRILTFTKGSLLAGGIGAIMFIPAFYALSYTASAESNFPSEWKNYFSVMNMLSRSLMSVEPSILNSNTPNIYCTVAVFLMIPLYCLCTKINHKEKVGKMAFLALLLVSFNLNIPNFIWHGFHFPNSLPCRESFIYIFLILTMSYEAAIHAKTYTKKQIYSSFFGAVGLIIVIEELFVNEETYPFGIIYMSLLFLTGYLVIINMYRNPKVYRQLVTYLLVIICIAEAGINSNHEAAYKSTGYSYYLKDNEDIANMLGNLDDDSFYRVEKNVRLTKNDAAWNDYRGVSVFSSTANGNVTELLGSFGFEKSTNAYSYYGYTPLTSSMLSVKYLLSDEVFTEPYLMELLETSSTKNLYEMQYVLPLGYMIPSDSLNKVKLNGNDPFVIQNSFVENVTGYTDLFTRLSAVSSGASSTISVGEDTDLYIYVTNYVESITYSLNADDGTFIRSGSASGLGHRQIVHIGKVPANGTVTVRTSDTDVSSLQLYAYAFDQELFDTIFTSLNDEGLVIESFDDTNITGTISAKSSGTMLTSIVYDRSWKAYIDGKEVKIGSFNDAFLTVDIPEGTHSIELKYIPDGFILGTSISIISILIIIVLCVIEKILRTKKAKKDATIPFTGTEANLLESKEADN